MKNEAKKVPRNFRLDSKIEAELRRRSKLTGIPETRLLEDALTVFFEKTMHQRMAELTKQLGKKKGGDQSTSQIDAMFEYGPTLSKSTELAYA